jgi:hypothetical protein
MVNELNIVRRNKGFFNSMLGEAHQHIIAGILLRLGFAIAAAPVRTGAYDLIVTAYFDRDRQPEKEILLRAQCRTVQQGKSLRLVGGIRGGVERIYLRPSPKEYKYTEEHNDLILAIEAETLDIFVIPTRLTRYWGKSVSVRKLEPLRNRFDILLNWNEDALQRLEEELRREFQSRRRRGMTRRHSMLF